MGNKANPQRETLKAVLGIIQTAETLEQARGQLTRMLQAIDKVEARGKPDPTPPARAEERPAVTPAPKTSAADERPVRRRPGGGVGPERL